MHASHSRVLVSVATALLTQLALAQGSLPGPVSAWGYSIDGATTVPSGMYRSVDAGTHFYLAINDQGDLVRWGRNSESWLPPALTEGPFLSACTGGGDFALGLRSDGSIAAWSASNAYGILNVPTGPFKAIAAGQDHAAALRPDGSLASWGSTKAPWNNDNPSQLPPGGPFKAIACGSFNIHALRDDGSIASAGYTWDGATGSAGGTGFTKVVGGWGHGLALHGSGSVATWGRNGDGERNVPAGTYTDIDAGGTTSVGLRSDGTVLVWGRCDSGVCAVPTFSEARAVTADRGNAAVLSEPPVIISGVQPISGPSTGGTQVTITGSKFALPISVKIADQLATDVELLSATTIRATTPAAFPGPASVNVNGVSLVAFYYRPDCGSDLDQNGSVDGGDLAILLLDWGPCYSSVQASGTQDPPELLADEPAQKPVHR